MTPALTPAARRNLTRWLAACCPICLVPCEPAIHAATVRVRATLARSCRPVAKPESVEVVNGTVAKDALRVIQCADCHADVEVTSRRTVRCMACQAERDRAGRHKSYLKRKKVRVRAGRPLGAASRRKVPGASR